MNRFDYVGTLEPADLANLDEAAVRAKLTALAPAERANLIADMEEQQRAARRLNETVDFGLRIALLFMRSIV